MRPILALVILLSLVVGAHAFGFFRLGGPGGGGGGGGGCTNKLDFSVACNSQYIPVI